MHSKQPRSGSLALPIVFFGCVGMVLSWVLTPSYGPWVANAVTALPLLIAALLWGETARKVQLSRRGLASGVVVGVTLTLLSWLVAPAAIRTVPALGLELFHLYSTLNRAPGPLRALPILLLAAAAEEAVWRGELVTWLRRRCGVALTLVAAVLAYSLPIAASGSLLLFAMANGLGAVFTLQRLTSGGWMAPFISHAIWALGVFVVRPIL